MEILTPKEKAASLLNKHSISSNCPDINALITINEILDFMQLEDDDSDTCHNANSKWTNYWIEVKKRNIKYMKIKHLREWLDTLPTELDENELVFRKIKPCDDDNWLAHDIGIVACGIDEGNSEAYFCDRDSYEVIK